MVPDYAWKTKKNKKEIRIAGYCASSTAQNVPTKKLQQIRKLQQFFFKLMLIFWRGVIKESEQKKLIFEVFFKNKFKIFNTFGLRLKWF